MIIVVGSVIARDDCLKELLALCVEHARRSRKEQGCLSHAVHQDGENPLRLVFVEEWADRGSLEAHFKVPASLTFVRAARILAVEQPVINIYDTTPLQL